MLSANVYARSKTENEAAAARALDVVGLAGKRDLPAWHRPRPRGPPRHWSIAAWPYPSVARLYGDGNNSTLPIVLVEDVADAMVKAIDVAGIEGESFNLAADPCITANDFLDELENRARIKLRRVPTTSAPRLYGEGDGEVGDPAARRPGAPAG